MDAENDARGIETMTDKVAQLHKTLDELRAQLAGIEHADPQVRAHLLETITQIRSALDASAEKPKEEDGDSLIDRLKSAAEHFEGSHPTLSGMISSTIDALGRMGI